MSRTHVAVGDAVRDTRERTGKVLHLRAQDGQAYVRWAKLPGHTVEIGEWVDLNVLASEAASGGRA